MQSWAKTWQMSFNYDKCKVMHFGKKNREQTYTMSLGQDEQPHVIEKSLVERDLGLMLSHDLKWVTQVEKATKAAKAIIAQIRNSFRYFDAELVRLLYVSLVRPHLEFAVPVWNPYLRKDIEKLENIQHRATRLAPRLRKRGYEYRLEQLRLTTLETRRKRGGGGLIQFYKVLNGHDHIKWKSEPEKILQWNNDGPASRNLRRGGIIFRREPATMCTPRNEFFLNRVFPLWNNLPQIIREAKSLNCFKAGLDRMELFKI
jgi:ribonucleases P/MRP protein subunit RPP40